MIGKTLGHYQIAEKLGEGGMGVVYKARDAHLDRFAALKVLPPEKVSDPDRKRRFIQEAKAASALNHPSIITIYDIDQADGIDFIAMEYVAGKTLDELIPRKGMRLSLALKYAVQIADALARAHGAGIIHRDLKPSNVMVDEHGLVKVLDFGLAKLTEAAGPEEETAATRTGAGMILGTAAYMSPEQAEGKHVDTRSDIFSFGSMLYEMLTGQRAFRGDTRVSTIASILREDPKPISQVSEGLPREVERIVRRCLRKDPEHRFQAMPDLRVALEELKEESDSGIVESAGAAKPKARHMVIWAIGAVAVLVAAITIPVGWYFLRQKADVVKRPLQIAPFTSLPGLEEDPKFSPDGKFVAFSWNGPAQDNWDIYVKQVGGGEALRLTTDPAAEYGPVWSPDGGEIAFIRINGGVASIYTMASLGGGERKIYESRGSVNLEQYLIPVLSWSPDGHSLAFAEKARSESPVQIYLLSLDTREKKLLTTPPPEAFGDFYPEFSPDGRQIAFIRVLGWGTCDLWTQPASSKEAARVTRETYQDMGKPMWTPDGQELVFPAGHGSSSLFRVPGTGGTPEPVVGIGEGAGWATTYRTRMVYVQSSSDRVTNIWRMQGPAYKGTDRSVAPLMQSTRGDNSPDYSPDGKKIAFDSYRSGFQEIWICNGDGTNTVQLTNLRTSSGNPRWSPDGKRIAFESRPEEDGEIYVISADGGTPQRLTNEKTEDSVPSWSRDGQWIYFGSHRAGNYQVWKVPSEGGRAVEAVKGNGYRAVESFDGRFLYFIKVGQEQFLGRIWKVPRDGGEATPVLDREVIWTNWQLRPEGIYFSTQTGRKYSIEFLSFATGKTTHFYQEETPDIREWLAISPDGQWLLAGRRPQGNSDLMLVENFR